MGTSVRVSKPRSACRKLTAGSRVSTIYFDRLAPRSSAPSIEGLSLSSSLPPWPSSLPSLPLSACSLWSCAWHYRVAAECNCGAPSASPLTGLPLPCSSAVRRCCSFFSPTLRYCVRLATSPLHRLLGSHYISKGSALYPQVLALWSSLLHRSASGDLHLCPCRPGPLRRRARIPSVQARVNLNILFAASLQLAVNSMFTHRAGRAIHAGCNAVARHRGADSRSLQAH